ncbi:MAG TPA: alanine--tRNA ligase, partial [Thermoplasmataceae archaeon]|nr:alanine--tRNA ligase [Thermoplasmataceae archaeon]
IRMNDIDLVGATGRHLTSFEMLCHDSFNYPDKEVYWKEETVEYCFNFLTDSLGIDRQLITFKEKPWTGGGNGGNAFEVFVKGLEVATLVFMDLKEDPNGPIDIDGTRYSKMSLRIVDTGYGLERLTWLSQGSPTVYHAVFPDVVDAIIRNSSVASENGDLLEVLSKTAASFEPFSETTLIKKVAEKLSTLNPDEIKRSFEFYKKVFALSDHAKTIAILLTNYAIPSNVRVGYLLRLLLRRSFFYLNTLKTDLALFDLVKMQYNLIRDILPPLDQEFATKIIDSEKKKYEDLMGTGKAAVLRLVDRKKKIDTEDLVSLYDSHGLNPEFVADVVRTNRGIEIEVPENFDTLVVSRHSQVRRENEEVESLPDLFTRPLYYDDPSIREFNALVLYSKGDTIIPNQTAFYPEGGGQPSDVGTITAAGKQFRMLKAEKRGNAILHHLDGQIPERTRIIGKVDSFVRDRHTAHHSATHLLLGTLIKVLGKHVWQTGVQKGINYSRIDITHYEKITDDTIETIEQECLKAIREGHEIKVRNLEWNRALDLYGFRLFQGGVPDGNHIRVVEIEGIDAEGCGGTHLTNTSQIGFIKIVKAEPIQEGIQRITFCAGDAALEYVQKLHRNERRIEQITVSTMENVTETVEKLYNENLSLKKEKSKLEKDQVTRAIESGIRIAGPGGEGILVNLGQYQHLLNLVTKAILSEGIEVGAVVISETGSLRVSIISRGSIAADSLARSLAEKTGGTAEGGSRFATVNIRGTDEILINDLLSKLLKQVLNA